MIMMMTQSRPDELLVCELREGRHGTANVIILSAQGIDTVRNLLKTERALQQRKHVLVKEKGHVCVFLGKHS